MALKHVKYHIVKRIASPGLMYDPGCSGLMHWDDPEGGDGEGGGRGAYGAGSSDQSTSHLFFAFRPMSYFSLFSAVPASTSLYLVAMHSAGWASPVLMCKHVC